MFNHQRDQESISVIEILDILGYGDSWTVWTGHTANHTSICGDSSTLCDLMSRWAMPLAWRKAKAVAAGSKMFMFLATGRGGPAQGMGADVGILNKIRCWRLLLQQALWHCEPQNLIARPIRIIQSFSLIIMNLWIYHIWSYLNHLTHESK